MIWPISSYNNIIKRRNQVENARAAVETVLKNRYDLIPNLVESVKQYMRYEESTLAKITEIRNSVPRHDTSAESLQKENQLSRLLGGILVSLENYPDLKSNTNMLQLQRSIAEVEEEISAARRAFNAAVMAYNNSVETFPSNIVGNIMGAKRMSAFEAAANERENPSVKNLFDAK
ncbi:MAG: LemA family protein [Flavobacterium sp.]|uniref:LemA family protein n=1 Tax=Flavobacterium sp. TaxID=239 RepID=UPI0012107966|nr:LemA family protein [Flavobacterium sp.]RZJ66214.1 MAG: LemA family protein [Flavobacterium sp.]